MSNLKTTGSRVRNLRRFRLFLVGLGFTIWSFLIVSSLALHFLAQSSHEPSLRIPSLALQILIAIGIVAPIGFLYVASILKRDFELGHSGTMNEPTLKLTKGNSRNDGT